MQRLEFSPNIKDQVEELIFKGNMNMLPHLQNIFKLAPFLQEDLLGFA